MKTLINRIESLENRDGFKSDTERREYLKYARLINPDVNPEQIRKPRDYLRLLEAHLEPLP